MPPDDTLAILINRFIASGGTSPWHMVGMARREGAGGQWDGG
jgi:hypothetical protein